jgi:protein-S-isoprenylcysteine O-methyltransferase Ste14
VISIIIARVQLGTSFALSAQAKELETHGLHSKICHPIYVFGLVLVLGLTLCIRTVPILRVWLTLFSIHTKRMKKGKTMLKQKFGRVYSKYKKRTWL